MAVRPVFVLSRGYLLDGEVQGAFTSLDLAQKMSGMGPGRWRQVESNLWSAHFGDGDKCWCVRQVDLVDEG